MQWFEPMPEAYTVLWWVPAGHIPTIGEAEERLDLLRREGPTAAAFTLRQPYAPPQSSDDPLRSANQPASSAEHSSSSTPATTSGR